MRNIEIKAKIKDYQHIIEIAQKLSNSSGTLIEQDDKFYNVSNGRLKMRTYADKSSTLVRYSREDEFGPKQSEYELLNFSSEEKDKSMLLDEMLTKCLGEHGRVIERRKLFMVGQTRVHIDSVKGLGDFMELEVVLAPEQTIEEGQAIAEDLQKKLGVENEDLIKCAYVDLLNEKNV